MCVCVFVCACDILETKSNSLLNHILTNLTLKSIYLLAKLLNLSHELERVFQENSSADKVIFIASHHYWHSYGCCRLEIIGG